MQAAVIGSRMRNWACESGEEYLLSVVDFCWPVEI